MTSFSHVEIIFLSIADWQADSDPASGTETTPLRRLEMLRGEIGFSAPLPRISDVPNGYLVQMQSLKSML